MNITQIMCHIITFGKHFESVIWYNRADPRYEYNNLYLDPSKGYGDRYCTECGYYLYTLCDAKTCITELRNSMKMWWESTEKL